MQFFSRIARLMSLAPTPKQEQTSAPGRACRRPAARREAGSAWPIPSARPTGTRRHRRATRRRARARARARRESARPRRRRSDDARAVGIMQKLGRLRQAENLPRESLGVLHLRRAGEFHAPAARGAGARPIGAAGGLRLIERDGKAMPRGFEAPERGGRGLRSRLAGHGVGARRHEGVDARGSRELLRPVHGREQRAGPDAIGQEGAQDHAAMVGFDRDQIGFGHPETRGVVRVQLAEGLGEMGRQAGRAAGAGHRVPLVANAPGVQHEGALGRGRGRGGGLHG